MKKFLILPIVAALAACSSNEDTVAKPVTPTVHPQVQPVPSTPKPEVAKPEQSKPEVAKPEEDTAATKPTAEKKPKLVPPYYAPHYGHEPVVPPVAPPPVQPIAKDTAPVAVGSNKQVAEAVENFKLVTKADGKIALPENDTKLDKEYANKGIKAYEQEGASVAYLLDPAMFGFEYQTFGPIYNNGADAKNRALAGYLSHGTRYILEDSKEFGANYYGYAIGNYDGKDTNSQLKATLNWGTEKSLTIETMNSQVSNGQKLNPNDKLDFTQTLNWDKNESKFKSKEGSQGFLYGDAAQEVGGTFRHMSDDKKYEGGFGASRAYDGFSLTPPQP